MISVSDAIEIIGKNVSIAEAIGLPLSEATGLVLADDIYATADIPAFPQSSMDGYALSFDAWSVHRQLTIQGEVAAGSNQPFQSAPDKAVRIFTGAPVPPGTDTVVMQEKTRTENGKLIIEDEKLRMGTNVRQQGSEIKAGMLALSKNTLLSPGAIGFLAGIGINEVKVYPNPTITIIVTGNEFQKQGHPLQYGQVYESNSFALSAVTKQINLHSVQLQRVRDDLKSLINVMQQALQNSDVVLLTGGISVGDYDFVLQAASTCGVEKLFHRVKQRPGKPLYFGKKDKKLVFGLPGNPSSVLTCFYIYVLRALGQLSNRSLALQTIHAPLAKTFRKDAGLTHFLKGHYDGNVAMPLDAQESYRMRSYALANCLIQIDEEVTEYLEGATVKDHLIRN